VSYVNEDKIAGFCILSAALGIGSGLIAFHFTHDESFGWGVGIVIGVIGLLVMSFFAKIFAIIDDLTYEEYKENDEDD
jgi:hypothetical protein